MSQSEDLQAIQTYLASQRALLPKKLASKEIDARQASRAEGIAMDAAQWFANLSWYERNVSDDAAAKARSYRQRFNESVMPHATAWVEATAVDVPEAKKRYAIDKKGQVVHKKSGTVVKPTDKTLPTDDGKNVAPGTAKAASGTTPKPGRTEPIEEPPSPPPTPKKTAVAQSSVFGDNTTVAVGLALLGVAGIAYAVRKPVRPSK